MKPMHLLRVIVLSAVLVPCAVIVACGEDEKEEDTGTGTGGGGGDSGGAADTGTVIAEEASTIDAPAIDGGACLDLVASAQGFTFLGDAKHEAGKGIVLSMTPGATPVAYRAFTAPAALTQSAVKIDVSATRDNGTWGATADDLVEVFSQFYGATTSYLDGPSGRLTMTGNAFELMLWNAPNVAEGNHPLSATALGNASASLSIATTWGTTGKVDVAIDAVQRTVNANTMNVAAQDKMTIALGGRARGSIPVYTLTFTKVCVDVQ